VKAVVIVPDGNTGSLELREIPTPKPGPQEVLIRVKATALNRADLAQRRGGYPAQRTGGDAALVIGGLEAAGEVADMGRDVSGIASGERVMAMCGGGYAEFVAVDHRLLLPVPERLSWEEAATIPVSYMTEHDALITNGRLQSGESVLVNAASSGVGIAAIQLAKLFGAQPVFGTSGSAEKLEALAALGLDRGINYQSENFADVILTETQNKGVDIIIDHVGASQFQDNLRCMALQGRLVGVGRLGGRRSEIDLDFIALRRLSLIGVTFRTRTLEERIAIAQRCKADVIPALADGRLRPLIDRTFALDEALEAQGYMESNAHLGKIVLTL
jgi:NADPH2:quinone reductase